MGLEQIALPLSIALAIVIIIIVAILIIKSQAGKKAKAESEKDQLEEGIEAGERQDVEQNKSTGGLFGRLRRLPKPPSEGSS